MLIVATLMLFATLLVSSALTVPSPMSSSASPFGGVSYPATVNGLLGKCGPVFNQDTSEKYYGTIPESYSGKVPLQPLIMPMFGYMSATAFEKKETGFGENPYTWDEVLRGQWEGWTFVWVNDQIDEEGYDFIVKTTKKAAKESGRDVQVLTWVAPDKKQEREIPLKRNVGFTSWNTSQSCGGYDERAFADFLTASERLDNDRDRENPPVAPLFNGALADMKAGAQAK